MASDTSLFVFSCPTCKQVSFGKYSEKKRCSYCGIDMVATGFSKNAWERADQNTLQRVLNGMQTADSIRADEDSEEATDRGRQVEKAGSGIWLELLEVDANLVLAAGVIASVAAGFMVGGQVNGVIGFLILFIGVALTIGGVAGTKAFLAMLRDIRVARQCLEQLTKEKK